MPGFVCVRVAALLTLFTIRRCLNCRVETGWVESSINCETGDCPRVLYR